MKMAFRIDGEWLTEFLRNSFYEDGNSFKSIQEIIEATAAELEMSPAGARRLTEDILLGRAEFTGNTADNTFAVSWTAPEDMPDIPDDKNIFLLFDKADEKTRLAEEKFETVTRWYKTAMEHLSPYQQREVLAETGQITEETDPATEADTSKLMDSVFRRMTDTEEHSTEDYGWLAPDGTFHPSDWGEHQEWAMQYLKKITPQDRYGEMLAEMDTASFGDELCRRGWILLDSPWMGEASPQSAPGTRMTKNQREFLDGYWRERGRNDLADALWTNA